MGLTKTEQYTNEQNELAGVLKALAHPARLAIIQQLLELNSCICGDFTREIGLAQPTISRHLKELKAADLIQGTIEGNSVCYCINPAKWRELQHILNKLFDCFKGDDNGKCC